MSSPPTVTVGDDAPSVAAVGALPTLAEQVAPIILDTEGITAAYKVSELFFNNLSLANVVQKLKEYKRKKEDDDTNEMEKEDALRKKNNEKHKK